MRLTDVFRKTKVTPNQLRAAIAEVETDAGQLASRMNELVQARAAALVDGDDAAVDRLETEQAALVREEERAGLRLQELRRRLEEAEKAEIASQERAARQKAEDAGAESAALHTAYTEQARAVAETLRRIRDLDAEVLSYNAIRTEQMLAEPGKEFPSPVRTGLERLPKLSANLSGPAPIYDRVVLPTPTAHGGVMDSGRHIWDKGEDRPGAPWPTLAAQPDAA
jgi:chromosome segregation ATPase